MTDDPIKTIDAGDHAAANVEAAISSVSETAPDVPGKVRRRRRKKRCVRKDQIDIAKVLLAPVRLLQGARSKLISVFEATLRAQVAKAIDGKDSASIKALIDHAIEYDLVAPPDAVVRTSGVFIVPKVLGETDQREIFDIETPMSRIIEIILRHYDKQS